MAYPIRRLVDRSRDATGEIQALDHHKADLVIQGFERLSAHELHWPSTIPSDTPTDISIDRLRSKRDIHAHLHSTLLPQLKQQVRIMSHALNDLTKLKVETAPKLELILAIQPRVHLSLDGIIRATDDIIPGNVPEPTQTNDQHYQEFKGYRLHGLHEAIRETLRSNMLEYFHISCSILEGRKLQTKEYPDMMYFLRYFLIRSIDAAMGWLKGSELEIITDSWDYGLNDIWAAGQNYIDLVDPTRKSPLSRPVLKLAQAISPVIKMSSLFFSKIAKDGMLRDDAPLYTEMSSSQLVSLREEAFRHGGAVAHLVRHLEEADNTPPALTRSRLISEIESLSTYFQSYLLLVGLYIVPLLPDTDGVSSQIPFKTGFLTFNTVFLTATHNAIQAAYSFERNEL